MRSDPPPYAWLDDPAQPFGPVGIGTTIAMGSLLGGIGLAAVVLVAVLALRRAVTGEAPTSAGGIVAIVLLGHFAGAGAGADAVGVMAVGRSRDTPGR